MVTVKDVAKLAGVSVATVSRVINDSDSVRGLTKDKVTRAMKELDYYPNNLAKNFSTQSTKRIALVVDVMNADAFANPYFFQVQFGIEKYLAEKGYSLSIYNKSSAFDKNKMLEKLLFERQVDGLIFHSILLDEEALLLLEKSTLPYISLGEIQGDINWVDVDNFQAGYLALKALLDDHHKNVCVLYNSETNLFEKNRIRGIKKICDEQSKFMETRFLQYSERELADLIVLVNSIIDEGNSIDGFIALDNKMAIALERVIQKKGYRIPEDIGLVTFDKYPVVDFSIPKMTTVDIDVMTLGKNIGMVLLENIESKSKAITKLKLSVELSRRETTRNR